MFGLFLSERQKYVKAMLSAIDSARYDHWSSKYKSKTSGLRVIKRFEVVNKIKFNPFDSFHVYTVSGWGWNEEMIRSLKTSLT